MDELSHRTGLPGAEVENRCAVSFQHGRNDTDAPSHLSSFTGLSSVESEITPTESELDTTTSSTHRQGKRVLILTAFAVLAFLGYERLVVAPEDRLIAPGATERLLKWVEAHPRAGIFVMVLCLTMGPLTLVPVTGPLGMGLGYVYTAVYGWSIGYPLATAVLYCGTVTGAFSCFFAGRYVMQARVKTWIQGNHILEALDIGESITSFPVSEHTFARSTLYGEGERIAVDLS